MGNQVEVAKDLFKQKVEERETQLPPEMFLGWRENKVIDFEPYEEIGFPHPKNSERYSMKDAFFKELYDNLKMRPYLDNPIHVYLYEGKVVVIDGATRLSIISLLKKENPSLFPTVPVSYCCGDKDEAIADMVRLNLNGRHRPLSYPELINSFKRFIELGWTQTLIAKRLGFSLQKARNLCKAIENCKSDKLIEALEKEPDNFKMTAFLNACDQNEEEQVKIAETVLGGKKVKAHHVKKQTVKQFLSQLDNVSTRILNPLSVMLRDRGKYDGDDGFKEAIINAMDAVDIVTEKIREFFGSELSSNVEEEEITISDEGCAMTIKAAYDVNGKDVLDKIKP